MARIFGAARSQKITPVPFTVTGEPASADGFTPLASAVSAPVASGPNAAAIPSAAKTVEWKLPLVKDILELGVAASVNEEQSKKRAKLIEETLASFGAPAQVVATNRGPTITQFGVEPLFLETRAGRTRVRVSKIVSLADDLALALAAQRIRIQAPVPGRSYLGIEVPNEEMALVTLRDLLESESFQHNKKPLSFALGQDVAGKPASADLAAMPHLLIAGSTGSCKSVCVNAILTSLLMYNTPDQLRLILVDPKRVELTGYNGIPHLLSPVVVDMDKVIGALQWMTREMDRRYQSFAQVGSRNILDYNAKMKTQGNKPLPYLVVVIDELADLMMIAPDETERTITRLAQLARATGIHLILATQRPSVDVVTGLIKANFPARVAFAVASNTDSRVILDQPGAERLLGRGDMLYQAPDAPAAARLQGVFVSDAEIHSLVDFWRMQNTQSSAPLPGGPVDLVPSNVPFKQAPLFEDTNHDMSPVEKSDPLYSEAVDLVRREGRASVSMLQRRMRIGYTRAARIIDVMEEKKIVGTPQDATGVRPVLDYGKAGPPKET
jgi:S-DNA-T family DNA segregation ATPase FtsK/SpoIIIE